MGSFLIQRLYFSKHENVIDMIFTSDVIFLMQNAKDITMYTTAKC